MEAQSAMTVSQICIESLQNVVNTLRYALNDIPSEAGEIYRNLDYVWLSSSKLNQWKWGGANTQQLHDIYIELQHRLDQARQIARVGPFRTLPNFTGPFYPPVTLGTDEWGNTTHLVTIDDAEISKEDLQMAADTLKQLAYGNLYLDGSIPDDLVAVLKLGCYDPEFCEALAKLVPPSVLADALSAMDREQSKLLNGSDPVALENFQTQYAGVLDAFGIICSSAATTMTGQDGDDYLNRWHDVFANSSPYGSAASLLSMVVARGMWPPAFLTTMKTGIESAEKGMGADFWRPQQPGEPDGVVDPGRTYQDGSPVVVADPMYGVWSAATYTPQWFIDTYQGHDLVDVVLDRAGSDPPVDQHEMVDSSIQGLIGDKRFDQASFWAFLQAASMADMWQDLNGQTGSSMHDVVAMVGVLNRDQRIQDELPWWDKHKHEVLEWASFALGAAVMVIPGVGWVTGGFLMAASFGLAAYDVYLYAAEGDIEDAIISGIFLIPMMVGGALRLVQISREAWLALKAGETIELLDQDVRLDGGVVVFAETGSKTPPMRVPETADGVFYPSAADALPGEPYYDGVGSTTVDSSDLAVLRDRWEVPKRETVAVGRTDIPGLEGVTFEAGAPKVRGEAGLLSWDNDPLLSSSDIQSPQNFLSQYKNHAEGGVLAQLDVAISRADIDADVEGTVAMIQSNRTGVCPICKSGLGTDPDAAIGVIKQFSLKYPNLTIIIKTDGPVVDYVVKNGVKIS